MTAKIYISNQKISAIVYGFLDKCHWTQINSIALIKYWEYIYMMSYQYWKATLTRNFPVNCNLSLMLQTKFVFALVWINCYVLPILSTKKCLGTVLNANQKNWLWLEMIKQHFLTRPFPRKNSLLKIWTFRSNQFQHHI